MSIDKIVNSMDWTKPNLCRLHEIESQTPVVKIEKSKTNSFNTDSILEKIRTIDPDITNPKQALALLYELQAMLDS